MPTTYTDSFNRSGQLVGATETGGGSWSVSTGTPSLNGSYLYLSIASQLAYFDTGLGDVDLAAQLLGSGTLVVRRDPNTQRCIRARMYSQSYSGTYDATLTSYTAYYNIYAAVGSSGKYCENSGFTRQQCGNSSFQQYVSGSCYAADGTLTGYNASLQSVSAGGTCTQRQTYSGTNYYVALERVAADGTVTAVGTYNVGSQPTVRLLAQASNVSLYLDGTLQTTITDADSASRGAGRHGLQGAGYFDQFSLTILNTAPNAPLLSSPLNAAVIDRTAANTFTWQFSDADATDVQSAYDLQVTAPGGAVTVYNGTGPTQSRTFPAGTFAAGAWQWQVRTYDAQGVVGPYSSASYFTASTPPATPTITSPNNGATIPVEAFAITWTAPAQDAYQVRRTADTATPTDAQVYSDTGTVASTTARTTQLRFATNGRTERVWVRVRSGGLWSAWATASVTVNYTPPAQPYVSAQGVVADGAVDVYVTCPVPAGSQPNVDAVDLFRRGSHDLVEERVAAGLTPVQGDAIRWRDWTPASGETYTYRALSYGVNGTTASS